MKNKFTNLCLISLLVLCGTIPLWASPPDWTVQPQDFANTANLIANLEINGNLDDEADNIIGFFVGEEIRAVAEPIMMNGEAMYFITTYSNQLANEEMSMRVYIGGDDAIYSSPDVYTFQKSQLLGSLSAPHIIRLFTDGDFPIAIEDIPEQTTLQGQPFMTIDLNDYVLREDNDFINWAYQINPDLEVSLSGSMLSVTATDPTWIGSTFLDLTATEVTSNQYSATKRVVFTSKEFFVSPLWDGLPNATVELGDLFPAFNLNEYEHSYDGNCLEFSAQPVLDIPDPWFARPEWTVTPSDFQYTMTTIHRVQFSKYYIFDGGNDLLGAFVNGEVRGIATPTLTPQGELLYFITIYSNQQNEEVSFQFYHEMSRNIYEIQESLSFQTNFSNPVETPIVLDVAPIKVDLTDFGGVIIYVCDEDWVGSQNFEYTVQDCDNPELSDIIEVTYTVSGEPLAIDLLDFKGLVNEKQEVELYWNITPSPNLKAFEIERTTIENGDKNWAKLDKIIPTGNLTRHFSYLDQQPLEVTNYYRLKMIEQSGAYSYSETIALTVKTTAVGFSFFPNPVIGTSIQLNWQPIETQTATVSVMDMNAHQVFQQKINNPNPILTLPELPAGLYLIKVETLNNNVWVEKMVIR